jgi:hypothetical protein
MIKIYKIIKPNTNEVYVGKTSKTLKWRFNKHKSNRMQFPDRKLNIWLSNECEIFLIEEVEPQLGKEREQYWIDYYKNNNFNMINSINSVLTKEQKIEAHKLRCREYKKDDIKRLKHNEASRKSYNKIK